MSRMMDSLARVLEQDKAKGPTKKTALFLVRDSITPSASGSRGRMPVRQLGLIWGFASLLVAGLAYLLWQDFQGGARKSGAAATSAAATSGENHLAVELLKGGQLGQAEALLRDSLRRQPGARAARLNHGFALKALGRFSEAEQEYRLVLRTAPTDAIAWNNLGVLYLRLNRLADAESALKRALENDPAYADAGLNLVTACERSRDWACAASALEKVQSAGGEAAGDARLRERLRRLRSLAASAAGPKEKF
jgi:Tfp pilus assembly protein PilF